MDRVAVTSGQGHLEQRKVLMKGHGVTCVFTHANMQFTFTITSLQIALASFHTKVCKAMYFVNHRVKFMMLYCRNLFSPQFTILAIVFNSVIITNYS